MKLALFSDLHLEFLDEQWKSSLVYDYDYDVIVLAGDIDIGTDGLLWARQVFADKSIIYVAGNHEFYYGHMDDIGEMRRVAADLQIHFLENATITLGNVRYIGATLWSGFDLHGHPVEAMREAHGRISDYRLIRTNRGRLLAPSETLRRHQESVAYLDAELSKPFAGKTVVVSHFAPHRRCVASEYAGTALSPYFVTDLSWLMAKHRIDAWCYGHTHSNIRFVAENGCRVVSNQRGYQKEFMNDGMGFHIDGTFMETD